MILTMADHAATAWNKPLNGTRTDSEADGWDRLLQGPLREWAQNPDSLIEAEIVPPSPEVLALATQFAKSSRSLGLTPPLRAVPNGEGGIAFEGKSGIRFVVLEIMSADEAELRVFENDRLLSRERLS